MHGSTDSWDDLDVYGTIAGGGMATIEYAGKATAAGTAFVALKRPRACFARDPEFAAMFLDEARLSLRIAHANVVRTLGVLERPLALVLEYVPGESLHDLLQLARRAEQPVPARVATALIGGVLHGLHAAHHTCGEDGAPLSIVHRDVTPGNILVGVDGVARLLDFGIAKAAGKLRATPCGEFKGKVAYVSPEQVGGGEATHRSDVYGAGLVLWEALAGRALFERAHDALTLDAIVNADVPSLCAQRCDVSPALDALVRRALCRDPRERFADAAEMARALEREVGVAGQSSVIDWLDQLAGERLRERAERLQALRMAEARSVLDDAASVAAADGGGTVVSRPRTTVVLAEPQRLALQRASSQPSAAGPMPRAESSAAAKRVQPAAAMVMSSAENASATMSVQPMVTGRMAASSASTATTTATARSQLSAAGLMASAGSASATASSQLAATVVMPRAGSASATAGSQPAATVVMPRAMSASRTARAQPRAAVAMPRAVSASRMARAQRRAARLLVAWARGMLVACAACELGAGVWLAAEPVASMARAPAVASIALSDQVAPIAPAGMAPSPLLAADGAPVAAAPLPLIVPTGPAGADGAARLLPTAAEDAAVAHSTLRLMAAASDAPAGADRPRPRRSRVHAVTDFGPRSPLMRSPVWLAQAQLGPSLLGTGLGRR
jgi:serine/threonine-protein kinase